MQKDALKAEQIAQSEKAEWESQEERWHVMMEAQQVEAHRVANEQAETRRTEELNKERAFLAEKMQRDLEFQRQIRDEDLVRLAKKEEQEKKRRKNKISNEIPPIAKLRDPKEIVHYLTGFRNHMVRNYFFVHIYSLTSSSNIILNVVQVNTK